MSIWEIYQVKDLYISVAMYANDWMDMSDETRVTSIPFTVEEASRFGTVLWGFSSSNFSKTSPNSHR